MSKHSYSVLCLGDSYTIGEGVALHESFPYQLCQILRAQNHSVHAPEIVAKTGWTSFELADHLLHHRYAAKYDFVTLLIGVNNQYRQLDEEDFANDFEFLLKKAIHFTDEHTENIICIAIPDWSVTPFGRQHTLQSSTPNTVDVFNKQAQAVCERYKAKWLDITNHYRTFGEANIVADQLHPNAFIYQHWADSIAEHWQRLIK